MDLKYQSHGCNKHHIRIINETLGGCDVTAFDSSKTVTSIWCDDNIPSAEYSIWWKSTSLDSVDKMVDYAKKQIQANDNINIIILEHSVKAIENLIFFVIVSKDNIVRTFQNKKDVCLYLRDVIERCSF